jgi:hypothetical protein
MFQKCVIALIEVVSSFGTSVYFNEITRRYIPEGYHLHTRHRKNLKSHSVSASSLETHESVSANAHR